MPREPDGAPRPAALTETEPEETSEGRTLDDLLEQVVTPKPEAPRPPGVRSARLVRVQAPSATVRFRGALSDESVRLAPDVDPGLVELAAKSGESVLVETFDDGTSWVIGMLQTRPLADLLLQAKTITLAAENEITLISGRAALRLRESGHVELVGTRISTISSGVLKLVGRLLRLN